MRDSQKPSAIQQYELEKSKLKQLQLTPKEYERRIKSLANKLGV